MNPFTNRIYVSHISGNIVVIDGFTNSVIEVIPGGGTLEGVGVNPLTNTVYVVNQSANSVLVIDGITNTIISNIPVGSSPTAIAVNP